MNLENMIQNNPQALVKSVNGVMVADSLQVADSFGKRHSHVLRAIENLITSLSAEEVAVNDEEWMYEKVIGSTQPKIGLSEKYFIPSTYKDSTGRELSHYWLTRDGFSLLVMGFTGPAALHWKLLYIEAFNKMEQALRSNIGRYGDAINIAYPESNTRRGRVGKEIAQSLLTGCSQVVICDKKGGENDT